MHSSHALGLVGSSQFRGVSAGASPPPVGPCAHQSQGSFHPSSFFVVQLLTIPPYRMDLHEDEEKKLVTATFELPGLKKEDIVHLELYKNK